MTFSGRDVVIDRDRESQRYQEEKKTDNQSVPCLPALTFQSLFEESGILTESGKVLFIGKFDIAFIGLQAIAVIAQAVQYLGF